MVKTKGHPDSRYTKHIGKFSKEELHSFDKEDYPKINYHLSRTHFPENETEKDRFRTMMNKVYDAEYKYQEGKITREARDEEIEIAEYDYDEKK